MIEKDYEIVNKYGLHARPCACLSKEAARFESSVKLAYNEHVVDAKSILGLMTLAAPGGSRIRLTVDGPDEKEAFAALDALVAEVLLKEELR